MSLKVLIAGGGTGGHLFPGVAMAESLVGSACAKILFVNAGRPMDVAVLGKAGFPLKTIAASGVKGMGVVKKLSALFKVAAGIFHGAKIIRDFRPDLVIGLGGYSAFPVVVAGRLLGLKVLLQEQNILPGITNRALFPLADRICLSFSGTHGKFNPKKVRVTGNPVRSALFSACAAARSQKDPAGFTVAIMGGSQGARSINKAVTEALDFLGQGSGYRFIHQTGKADYEAVANAYENAGLTATVQPFFDDMGKLYGQADLLICRAGATTIAEVSALGVPALFIPYPHAADNHQVLNAGELVGTGAADLLLESDLSGKKLGEKIVGYAKNRHLLSEMAENAKKDGTHQAAENILAVIRELVDCKTAAGT